MTPVFGPRGSMTVARVRWLRQERGFAGVFCFFFVFFFVLFGWLFLAGWVGGGLEVDFWCGGERGVGREVGDGRAGGMG